MDPYANLRQVFHGLALELMNWQDPPVMTAREYRNREGLRDIYKPADKQGETEPFNIDLDAEEHGI